MLLKKLIILSLLGLLPVTKLNNECIVNRYNRIISCQQSVEIILNFTSKDGIELPSCFLLLTENASLAGGELTASQTVD